MRKAIRRQLLPIFGGQVYEPSAAGAETKKPYAVVMYAEDAEESPATTYARGIEVWIFTEIGPFATLDGYTAQVIDALHLVPFTDDEGNQYTASYQGTQGADSIDTEFNAQVRGLSFKVIALTEDGAGTEWDEALAKWLTELIHIPIYSGKWSAGFQVPSGLVRTTAEDTEGVNHFFARSNRTIAIHLIDKDAEALKARISKVAIEALKAIKIPLIEDPTHYITIDGASVTDGDELTEGQIVLQTSRLIDYKRPKEYIQKIQGRRITK